MATVCFPAAPKIAAAYMYAFTKTDTGSEKLYGKLLNEETYELYLIMMIL